IDNKVLEDKYRDSVNVFQKEDINLEKRKKHAISKNKKVSMAISTDRHGLSLTKTALRFNEQDLNIEWKNGGLGNIFKKIGVRLK
ncbi:13937_t:CDS:2, partial [Funneliformis caledonium]